MRLDTYLTEQGHFESRSRARQAIEQGAVRVNGAVITKPAHLVGPADAVEADTAALQYVSRGGYKLETAIRFFRLDFQHAVLLDVGASTGGFTDCALQHGARQVFAVDVGHDQLHPSLRDRPGVVNLEGQDIRTLTPEQLGEPCDWILVDASFISLRHILPVLPPFLKPGGKVVALVKPQFEQNERRRFRGGIVRDKDVHRQTLARVTEYAEQAGFRVEGLTDTDPGEGKNAEFLAVMARAQGKVF